MNRTLFRLAAAWTVVGLMSGLFYRTLTHSRGFTGVTRLSVTHTHSLALGMMMMLILLALSLALRELKTLLLFRWGVWTYTGSLVVTWGTMVAKGTMQVLGAAGHDSPALNGVSGLGHMGLTAALVMILIALGKAVAAHEDATAA